MTTSAKFTGYRSFKSYSMAGLSRVNLLVGRNNSGKTSLLEGLRFLASGGDPDVLIETATARGEVVIGRDERGVSVDPSHFFLGHDLTARSAFQIEGDPATGCVRVSAKNLTDQEEGLVQVRESDTRAGIVVEFVRGHGKPIRHILPLTRSGGIEPYSTRSLGAGRYRSSPRPSRSAARFIGTDSWHYWTLASSWDEITLSGREDDVTQALQIIDPRVRSVRMLGGAMADGISLSRTGFVVGFEGEERRIPIGSLGEGSRRLLVLAAAIATARGGALFVDEIDTGLHHSVLSKVWRVLIERSLATDVQVFASTHSWDCIEALARVASEQPEFADKIAIHKIEPGLSHSVPFSGASLLDMIRNDIDPR